MYRWYVIQKGTVGYFILRTITPIVIFFTRFFIFTRPAETLQRNHILVCNNNSLLIVRQWGIIGT